MQPQQVSAGLFALHTPEDRLTNRAQEHVATADIIVCGSEPAAHAPLRAKLFVTERGMQRLGQPRDQFGNLAALDLWFRGVADNADIVVVDVDPGTVSVAPIPAAELVARHLGYLPVQWAEAIAEFDQTRSAKDYLQAYSYSTIAQDNLGAAGDEQASATRRAITQFGLHGADHCHRTATREEIDLEPHVPRKVGPQFWAFDRLWYREQRSKWHDFIYAEAGDPRPYVIAGNGPSLRDSLDDLARHCGELRLVTSNFAALEEELVAQTHVHTVVNYMVAEQAAGLINLMPAHTNVVVPFWLSYCIRPRPNVFFTETTADLRFSTATAKELSWIHTVSFYAMQLAFGLSSGDVGLVGFDHSYNQPAVAEGAEVIDTGPDTNHFRADYFSGRRWQAADTDMMETVYDLAGKAYARQQRELINCTVGGHLELFTRSSLPDFLANST